MADHHHFEELQDGETTTQHLIAGAFAGTAEHCAMFPIDTIKTNMQAVSNSPQGYGIWKTTQNIISKHGVIGLFRGVSAVASGAAPAHAMHFATYEFCKKRFGGSNLVEGHHPVATGAAGVCATVVSDAILTPLDAVKQRMQLGSYKSMISCIKDAVSAQGGVRGLYAGYTTTLFMNVPYNACFFASYESFRRLFKRGSERELDIFAHFIAGALAGSFAAALTNPFDVVKTRLQTQFNSNTNQPSHTNCHHHHHHHQHNNNQLDVKYKGMIHSLTTIWKEEGINGYLRGIKPRVILHSTSAAICWVTYEWMKHLLFGIGTNR